MKKPEKKKREKTGWDTDDFKSECFTNGYNQAWGDWEKFLISEDEMAKIINEFVLFCCDDPNEEWHGQPVTFKDYNKEGSGEAIAKAISKRLRGEE